MFISMSSTRLKVKVKGQGQFSTSKLVSKFLNCNNSKTICQRWLKLSPNALECKFPSYKPYFIKVFPIPWEDLTVFLLIIIIIIIIILFFSSSDIGKVLWPIGLKFYTLIRLFQEGAWLTLWTNSIFSKGVISHFMKMLVYTSPPTFFELSTSNLF